MNSNLLIAPGFADLRPGFRAGALDRRLRADIGADEGNDAFLNAPAVGAEPARTAGRFAAALVRLLATTKPSHA